MHPDFGGGGRKMKKASRAPIYTACVYPDLAEICREAGYALAVHGSLARDFDLVAIPWVENVIIPEIVVQEITKKFSVKQIGEPECKLHGRLCYTLAWMGEAFIDFSFMPVQTQELK